MGVIMNNKTILSLILAAIAITPCMAMDTAKRWGFAGLAGSWAAIKWATEPFYGGAQELWSNYQSKKEIKASTEKNFAAHCQIRDYRREAREQLIDQWRKNCIAPCVAQKHALDKKATLLLKSIENHCLELEDTRTTSAERRITLRELINEQEKEYKQISAELKAIEGKIHTLSMIPAEQTTFIPSIYDFVNNVAQHVLGKNIEPIAVWTVSPNSPAYFKDYAHCDSTQHAIAIDSVGADEIIGAVLCDKIRRGTLIESLLAPNEQKACAIFRAANQKAEDIFNKWIGIISHECGHLHRNSNLKRALANCAAPLAVIGGAAAIASLPAVGPAVAGASLLAKLGIGACSYTGMRGAIGMLKKLYGRYDEYMADTYALDDPKVLEQLQKMYSAIYAQQMRVFEEATHGTATLPKSWPLYTSWIPSTLNTLKLPLSVSSYLYEPMCFIAMEHPSCRSRADYYRRRLENLAHSDGASAQEDIFHDALSELPETFFDAQ